jgi:hypothetical protein
MGSLLAEILEHPEQSANIPPEVIPRLLTQIAALQAALAARLLCGSVGETEQKPALERDTLLTAEQAAPLLNVTPRWLYRHWKQLSFARRLSRKVLRFSENGIRKYQSSRKP